MNTGEGAALILVVDDDRTTRLVSCHTLRRAGYEVLEAENGTAALELFSTHRPSLVLMDVVMPEMDGFAACAAIRDVSEFSSTPILMLTSLEDPESIGRAFDAGATDFITKPIIPPLLVERVRFALRAQEMAEELRASRARLALTQHVARVGHWEYDPGADLMRWGEDLTDFLGLPARPDGVSFEEALSFSLSADRQSIRDAMDRALAGGDDYRVEHRIVLPDRSVRVVFGRGEVQRDSTGAPVRVIGSMQDITDLRQLQARLDYALNYDRVTGLPNRTLLRERLLQTLGEADRHGLMASVIVLDLEGFRDLSDTLGSGLADDLAEVVARRLEQCREEGDTVARISDGEFAVVSSHVGRPEAAATLAQRVLDSLSEPVSVAGQEVFVTPSVGIAVYPIDTRDPDALVQCATTAMSRGKGARGYRYFTADMNARAMERLAMESDLRRALERDELSLVYQPQVELTRGQVVGAEALLRWHHPQRGQVPAGTFVPVLEELGLLTGAAGQWTLRRACGESQSWRENGVEPLRVSVNVSARQLADEGLPGMVERVLADVGLDPRCLELELTESTVMQDPETTLATLHALRAIGVRLAVDDFGTGYSSLSYLKKLPLDVIKVDRSFVLDLADSADGEVIVHSMIELAHNLGLKVVAEGVEDQATCDLLSGMGCDVVQGYLFARPMTAAALADWLRGRSP